MTHSPRRAHRPVVMAVHAHPDDESSQTGGTLARYAANGYRTVLVTCTDGGQGDGADGAKPGQAGHDPRTVAQMRSRELDLAAAALGVSDVIKLGYPDSGVAEDSDSSAVAGRTVFSQLELKPLVIELVRLMRLFRPDVVLTYPPNGLSLHPDHIRTHDIVVAAHRNIVGAADWGPHEEPGPRLYYIALSRGRIHAVQQLIRATQGEDAWVPPIEMAVDDALITTVIDIDEFWEPKLRALSAHASQADSAALLQMFSAADSAAPGARVEEYVRAYPPPQQSVSGVVEHDFF